MSTPFDERDVLEKNAIVQIEEQLRVVHERHRRRHPQWGIEPLSDTEGKRWAMEIFDHRPNRQLHSNTEELTHEELSKSIEKDCGSSNIAPA